MVFPEPPVAEVRLTSTDLQLQERPVCAICGSHERAVHRAFRDIPIVRCRCGFLYSSRTMNSACLESYYRQNFGSQRHLQGQIVNASTNAVVLKTLLNLHAIRSWLDVGTGYGCLLQWLRKQCSMSVEGVELSQQEATYARDRLELNVHSLPLNQAPLSLRVYDVVSCFEVIEHITEPIPFLVEMLQYVRPGGFLLLMTDNFESATVKALGSRFPKWIPHTHVSHFGPASLKACISKVPGLTVEKEASYTPWDLVGRRIVNATKSPLPDQSAYDVRSTLSTEMNGTYKLYRLRRVANPVWARLTVRKTADRGALMYFLCRRS